jgi:hypothetical protein
MRLPPNSTRATRAQREAEHGLMCRSERFCALSTAQAQPHEALKRRVIWREIDDPADNYGTMEYAWDDASSGKFPREQGFVYNDVRSVTIP